MEDPLPDFIIMSSDRYSDIGPYSTSTFKSDPDKWGDIFPWEFPQNASREDEEAFLREYFSWFEIHIQGGAHGAGNGYRFLKQIWYCIAISNAEQRIPELEKWWWEQEGSKALLQDEDCVNRMLAPDANVSILGIKPEVTNCYSKKFLYWLMKSIQKTTFDYVKKQEREAEQSKVNDQESISPSEPGPIERQAPAHFSPVEDANVTQSEPNLMPTQPSLGASTNPTNLQASSPPAPVGDRPFEHQQPSYEFRQRRGGSYKGKPRGDFRNGAYPNQPHPFNERRVRSLVPQTVYATGPLPGYPTVPGHIPHDAVRQFGSDVHFPGPQPPAYVEHAGGQYVSPHDAPPRQMTSRNLSHAAPFHHQGHPGPALFAEHINEASMIRLFDKESGTERFYDPQQAPPGIRRNSFSNRGGRARGFGPGRGRGSMRGRPSFGSSSAPFNPDASQRERRFSKDLNYNTSDLIPRHRGSMAESWRSSSDRMPVGAGDARKENQPLGPISTFIADRPSNLPPKPVDQPIGKPREHSNANVAPALPDAKIGGFPLTFEQFQSQPQFEFVGKYSCGPNWIGDECTHVTKLIIFDVPVSMTDEEVETFFGSQLRGLKSITRPPLSEQKSSWPKDVSGAFATFRTHWDARKAMNEPPRWENGSAVRIEVMKEYFDSMHYRFSWHKTIRYQLAMRQIQEAEQNVLPPTNRPVQQAHRQPSVSAFHQHATPPKTQSKKGKNLDVGPELVREDVATAEASCTSTPDTKSSKKGPKRNRKNKVFGATDNPKTAENDDENIPAAAMPTIMPASIPSTAKTTEPSTAPPTVEATDKPLKESQQDGSASTSTASHRTTPSARTDEATKPKAQSTKAEPQETKTSNPPIATSGKSESQAREQKADNAKANVTAQVEVSVSADNESKETSSADSKQPQETESNKASSSAETKQPGEKKYTPGKSPTRAKSPPADAPKGAATKASTSTVNEPQKPSVEQKTTAESISSHSPETKPTIKRQSPLRQAKAQLSTASPVPVVSTQAQLLQPEAHPWSNDDQLSPALVFTTAPATPAVGVAEPPAQAAQITGPEAPLVDNQPSAAATLTSKATIASTMEQDKAEKQSSSAKVEKEKQSTPAKLETKKPSTPAEAQTKKQSAAAKVEKEPTAKEPASVNGEDNKSAKQSTPNDIEKEAIINKVHTEQPTEEKAQLAAKKIEKPKGPAQTESLNPFARKQTQKKARDKKAKTLRGRPKPGDLGPLSQRSMGRVVSESAISQLENFEDSAAEQPAARSSSPTSNNESPATGCESSHLDSKLDKDSSGAPSDVLPGNGRDGANKPTGSGEATGKLPRGLDLWGRLLGSTSHASSKDAESDDKKSGGLDETSKALTPASETVVTPETNEKPSLIAKLEAELEKANPLWRNHLPELRQRATELLGKTGQEDVSQATTSADADIFDASPEQDGAEAHGLGIATESPDAPGMDPPGPKKKKKNKKGKSKKNHSSPTHDEDKSNATTTSETEQPSALDGASEKSSVTLGRDVSPEATSNISSHTLGRSPPDDEKTPSVSPSPKTKMPFKSPSDGHLVEAKAPRRKRPKRPSPNTASNQIPDDDHDDNDDNKLAPQPTFENSPFLSMIPAMAKVIDKEGSQGGFHVVMLDTDNPALHGRRFESEMAGEGEGEPRPSGFVTEMDDEGEEDAEAGPKD